MSSDQCPRCGSPYPDRHPAIQFEGEVQVCPDPWHTPIRDPDAQSAMVMQTYTGEMFDIFNPTKAQIQLRDISHALSMLCRYGGHSRNFYSVAEHCYLIAEYFEDRREFDLARAALLHDSAEAYMGDVIRPMKLRLPLYIEAENRLLEMIFTRFGMPPEIPLEVKEADLAICNAERAALLHERPWSPEIDALPALDVEIHSWFPLEAEQKYMDMYWRLFG